MGENDDEALNNIALEQLTCPVCTKYCSPPIRQCTNGHITCIDCWKQLKKICALCKAPLTTVRNIVAEQLCSTVRFPCRFNSTGCELMIQHKDMDDHAKVCPFAVRCQFMRQSVKNPGWYVPCKWSGVETSLIPHAKSHHKPYFSKNGETKHKYPLRRKTDVRLIQSGALQFWSILTYDFKTYTMKAMVFLVGLTYEAASHAFKYETSSKKTGLSIVHTGTVVSLEEAKANLMEFINKIDSSTPEAKDKAVMFQGQPNLKSFVRDGAFKCRVKVVRKPRDAAEFPLLQHNIVSQGI